MDAMELMLQFGMNLRYSDLPQHVIDRIKMAILDTFGTMIAGIDAEGIRGLTNIVSNWGGNPQSTLLPTGRRVPLPWAVLINGVCARAWDLDDVHESATCHISAALVPTFLAAAEARGPVSGRDFITAMAGASEIMCRMALAPRISFSTTGMSFSYHFGTFGAAFGMSKLLRLNIEQARNAMGIAYALIAGNQQGFLSGALTVRLMQGICANSGVMAALTAEQGLTGSNEILEGKFGYYPVFHRGQYEPAELTDHLGTKWRLGDISVKPLYPCCKYTHGPIDAAIAAMKQAGCSADEILKVEVHVSNKEVYDLVCHPREKKWRPQKISDAQFSLPYTVAVAILYGKVSLIHFKESLLRDPTLEHMMDCVHLVLHLEEQGDRRAVFPMPGVVTIHTKSGGVFSSTVEYVKGHPKNPCSFEDVAEKFRSCVEFGIPNWSNTDILIKAVRKIEEMEDISDLMKLFGKGSKP